MQKKSDIKSVAAALGAGFAVSLSAVGVAQASDNPFAVTQFESGYMVAAEGGCGAASETPAADTAAEGGDKAAEGSCGGGSKSAEGKCGN